MADSNIAIDHFLEELQNINVKIILGLDRWKKEHSEDSHELMGLYVSDEEVNAISDTLRRSQDAGSLILKMGAESGSRIEELQKLFGLSLFETDALLVCMAAELDLNYEKLYSYLQNDVTKKRPTVDLVINLLCAGKESWTASMESRIGARAYFSPSSKLIAGGLIALARDEQEGQASLLSRAIRIDERVIGFIVGSDEIDRRLAGYASLREPVAGFGSLEFPQETIGLLKELARRYRDNSYRDKKMLFLFNGPYGAGKKSAAEAFCKELGKRLLVVDSRAMAKGDALETMKIIIREAVLQKAILYLDKFEALAGREPPVDTTDLMLELDHFGDWAFIASETPWMPPDALENHGLVPVIFSIPAFTVRKKLWGSMLEGHVPGIEGAGTLDVDSLATKFNFSGGQIKDAINTAYDLAAAVKPKNTLSMEDLYNSCKAQSNKSLTSYAKIFSTRYTWADIVLQDDLKEHLREISSYVKNMGAVYSRFGDKLSLGKGLNVLFSGPSGTGKTMAAGIIARETCLDMYKIDLSTVVSKYIGETEKILGKIFYEAQTSNAILFFDEADALFGKRSEVNDSHDRYANIEINYLLQKMEEHEGIVILASNFRSNIDEAFIRRMQFVVEFTLPDSVHREQIWKGMLSDKKNSLSGADYRYLAGFKVTGGNIKNIAANGVAFALDDGEDVCIKHLVKAVKREYQKMGRLCTASEFGDYYYLVK